MNIKNFKILLIAFIPGLVFLIIIYPRFLKSSQQSLVANPPNSSSPQVAQNDKPQIISTKPDPLEEAIISAAEIVEISFNRPLENVGEFKSRIEPKIEYKVELSGDRKTARIIPAKPYELGTTYTLFIGPDSKFDGVGEWRQDKTFHFKTVKYRGV